MKTTPKVAAAAFPNFFKANPEQNPETVPKEKAPIRKEKKKKKNQKF